jgi:hypothetical protein
MAIPFLQHIDLNKNELQNAVIQNLGTAPSSPAEGQIYYDSTGGDKKLYFWNGTGWISTAEQDIGDIESVTLTAGDGIDITQNNSSGGDYTSTISTDVKANSGIVIDSTELALDLAASSITGTLAVADGGTGATSLTSNAILTGNGTSAIQAESTLTYDGTTLTQANATPHFVMTDTTTNADVRLSSNSAGGSFSISADFNNEANTTKIHMFCDGDEVGHFRGNNAYVGSLRLFPEKNDNTDQGIFVGTDAAGVFDPDNDWNYKRIISYGATDTLHLYPGTSTTGVIQITSSGDITTKADTITFGSANSTDPLVIIKNTTNDTSAARLHFVKDKGAAGADGDDIGTIEFISDDAGQTQTSFAKIVAEVSESDNTDEAGKLSFYVAESDGTTTTLTAGLVLEGEHATNGEVDVTIGAGAESTTTIVGDLVVNGSHTTVASTTVAAGDNMFKFAKDNSSNSIDIGWYGKIVSSGTKYPVAYYDASTGISTPKWLFGITTTEPGNTADIETKGTIVANLEGNVTGNITGTVLTATQGTIDHDSLANFAANEHFTQASITTVGTIGSGTWAATDVAVLHGGTGASTASAALTNLGAEPSANKITKLLSGDGSNTTYSITHGFGTPLVSVQVLHAGNQAAGTTGATYDVVQVEIERDTDNAVDIIFGTAPTTTEDYFVLISKYPAVS